jgi:erythronate-4-phosphate dehydrogenase
MKVIVDNKIPYIAGEIEKIADKVVYLPGDAFTKEEVKEADALVIRTRTHCNRDLLEGSQVKFIVTATIGFDHIDTEYCHEAGIAWTNCPGCNAGSVEQYIHSVLLLLKREKGLKLEEATLGIVGVGHVGSRVKRMAESLGMKVLLNDPPRADKGEKGFVDLRTIASESDVITFHTPLIKEGTYRTCHLVDEDFLFSLKRNPVIINSSRGEVVDTASLLIALSAGKVKDAVIDTWEYEPVISRELMEVAFLATPHIAGYSADGKANATRMSLEALARFFGVEADFCVMPPEYSGIQFSDDAEEAYLQAYNPTRDSEWLKKCPEKFEWFRGSYPLRREM